MYMTEQIPIPGGILSYDILGQSHASCAGNGTLCIVSYRGDAEEIVIPAQIEGRTVTAVGKKAFFGNRYLRSAKLPHTIEVVGDWAFSGCRMLHKIEFPKKEISFGRHVFQKSDKLQEILLTGEDKGFASLLAVAVTVLEAEYLLSPFQVGSDSWYQSVDARILAFLKEPEESILKDLVYCAEEDMGAKQEACLRKHACRKANVAFLRLLHPAKMTTVMKQHLTAYLRERTKGSTDEAAWEALKACPGNKLSYCDKLYEIGGISEENIHDALDDLGEDNIELKAYLLQKWQDRQQEAGIWTALDWE